MSASNIKKIRLKKLDKIRKLGINPFPEKTKRSHSVEEVLIHQNLKFKKIYDSRMLKKINKIDDEEKRKRILEMISRTTRFQLMEYGFEISFHRESQYYWDFDSFTIYLFLNSSIEI